MQFSISGIAPIGVTAVLKELKDSPGCFGISLSHQIIIAAQSSRVVDSSVIIKTGPTEMALVAGNLDAAERCLFVHLQTILPNTQSAVILHLVAVEDRQVTVPKDMVIATLVPISLTGSVAEEVDSLEDEEADDVDIHTLNKVDLIAYANARIAEGIDIAYDPNATKAAIIEAIEDATDDEPDTDDEGD